VHYLHLRVPLSALQREQLTALLDYGPKQSLPSPVPDCCWVGDTAQRHHFTLVEQSHRHSARL
jgi:hypothetical protein